MKIAISFTGGKDSTAITTAFQLLRQGKPVPDILAKRCADAINGSVTDVDIACLVTFVPKGPYTSFKAHPLHIMSKQAAALGLPHVIKEIEGPDYLNGYATVMKELAAEYGIEGLATGDILDVCSNFMGNAAAAAGMPLVRPLWHIPRQDLLNSIWDMGISALISCVNVDKFKTEADKQLPEPAAGADLKAQEADEANHCHMSGEGDKDGHFSCFMKSDGGGADRNATSQSSPITKVDPIQDVLGKMLTRDLHKEVLVPAFNLYGVDQCGEHGEFHTICVDGPTFASRLELQFTKDQAAGTDYAHLVVSDAAVHAK